MRFLIVHPGASVATADVHDGLVRALADLGHEIALYSLDGRIEAAGYFYKVIYDREKRAYRAGKRSEMPPRPLSAQILHLACAEVINMALADEVDWVIVMSGMYFPDLWLTLLKRAGMRVGVVLTESPYDDRHAFRLAEIADICWVNERTSVEPLRYANPHVYYLPHAYNPDLHAEVLAAAPDDTPAHDVVFVGTLFQERIEILSAVNWDGIDFAFYGAHDLLGSRHKLRKYVQSKEIMLPKAVALYRKAKIGLNLYRTSMGFGPSAPRVTTAESINPRALDLAALGVFTIADERAEQTELFGALVPTFREPRELEYLIRSWLANDCGRTVYAERLPQLVRGQTYAARARQMLDDLGRVHPGPVALRDQPAAVG